MFFFSEIVMVMMNRLKDFVSSNSVCNHTHDKQIGLPLRVRPILLITCMITDRIGLHLVLLLIINKLLIIITCQQCCLPSAAFVPALLRYLPAKICPKSSPCVETPESNNQPRFY